MLIDYCEIVLFTNDDRKVIEYTIYIIVTKFLPPLKATHF